jgi:hypothetical protein
MLVSSVDIGSQCVEPRQPRLDLFHMKAFGALKPCCATVAYTFVFGCRFRQL